MKQTIFYVLLFAFVTLTKAQNAPANINNVLLRMPQVTASNIPSSGWFQLVADKQIEDLKLKPIQVFNVLPYAATDIVTLIQPSDKATAGTWQLFDSENKLLWSQRVNEKEIESSINVQSLSEGIYFVSFSVNGQKRYTQKLIKIKSN
jgi:hypothetical protein